LRLKLALLMILMGWPLAVHAAPERVIVNGQPAAVYGEFDPSIQYDGNGVGYMAYSLVSGPGVSTVLAKSTDHGASWNYVQALNVSQSGTVSPSGTPVAGVWRHEVPTLINDPADTGKEWKLYWHRYFTKEPYEDSDRMFDYGWIAYKYASNPEGAWSAEIALFGCSPFPQAPYSTLVDLRTLHPALNQFLAFSEPGGFRDGSRLYLAMQGGNLHPEQQTLFLISSPDHGASWNFCGYLATSQEASDLGCSLFTAPALAEEAGRYFLLASPQNAFGWQSGTYIFEFSDLPAATLFRDDAGKLNVTCFLAPTISTTNAGEAAYHAGNTGGGILFPQLQITPSIEFQIWNTHATILSPTPSATHTLTPTATPSPAVTATPTTTQAVAASPTDSVRAFPNPASSRVRFLVSMQQAGRAKISLYNLAGERVAELSGELAEGSSEMVWECGSVGPGVYVARVKLQGSEKQFKIAIAR